MSDTDAFKSVFEDPSDLEMDDLTKPNPILKLQWSIRITPVYLTQAVPHHGTSHWSYSYGTTVVSELSVPASNNIAIAPIIPTDPLFPPHLWPQKPYHLERDITEVRRGTCFIKIEDKDDDYYWITCQMDKHRSQIFNSSQPRSCDRS